MSESATPSIHTASVEVKRLISIMSFFVSSRSRFVLCALALSALALPALAGSSPEGIENFYQVDQNVYRGAQPTDDGFKYLAKIGVKTVIDLREADQRAKSEETAVTAAGMKYINVPMSGLTAPTEAQISRILG